MTACPACQREVQGGLVECPFCGVIFAKWKGPKTPSSAQPPSAAPVLPQASGSRSRARPASAVSILTMIAVVSALFAIGGYLWFQNNKNQLKEHWDKAAAEGQLYGNGKPSNECIAEAMRRLKSAGGFDLRQELSNKSFLHSCLAVAVEPADFCKGVPPKSEIMKSVSWILATCESAGSHAQACGRLVKAILEHCEKKRQVSIGNLTLVEVSL